MRQQAKPTEKVTILGAGPCGLGAAWRLKERGFEGFEIFEAVDHAGGLASSFVDSQGFTWDIGGHVQFSHYEDFDRVMEIALPNGWLEHSRESWVWIRDRFVAYPFQNNFWKLDEAERQLCLDGLEAVNKAQKSGATMRPKNFDEWIDQSFGAGIADIFLKPYNKKVWAYAPEKLSCSWMGERVATIDLDKIKKNLNEKKDEVSWGPNAKFQFPKKGGTGAIWKSVAEKIGIQKIKFKKRLQKIDTKTKTLFFEDGSSQKYEILLSTLSLNHLMESAKLSMKDKLLFSDSHIIGIGLRGQPPEHLRKKSWMYFPEDNCPFYRVTVFSNYSPANVPDSKTTWSLMCETSSSTDKSVDEQKLIENTIQGLINSKLITKSDEIISKWSYVARPGYPTPSLNRDEIVEDAFSQLKEHQIYSRGRFGAWKYEVSNQDHTFMQGFEWADWFLNGTEEQTVNFPQLVNASGKRSLRTPN
ncbi:MAG: FAD-dependent oxidoreductase [Deltaproteobacteria bacterium]|nr:FAD-dependent oxidoreductase [Deltaproteobacteria bacterium]